MLASIATALVFVVLAAQPGNANQDRFQELVKELGAMAASASVQENPQLQAMLRAGVVAKRNELAEFLKSLGPEGAKLRLPEDPLSKQRDRLEAGRQAFEAGTDPMQRAIDLCKAAMDEQDPLLREGALMRLERQLRGMGQRQGALPDEAIISTDLTITNDIVELFLSPAKNIKLAQLPNENLLRLFGRLLASRARTMEAHLGKIAWLDQEERQFGEILAAAGLLPQGTFVGTAEATGGEMTISDGDEAMKAPIPAGTFVGKMKLVLSGTQVHGVITFGEGEGRSAARLRGRLDPVGGRVQFEAFDPTLRGLAGIQVLEFRCTGTGGVVAKDNVAGDWQLSVAVEGAYVDETQTEHMARLVLAAKGTWRGTRE